MKTFFAGILKTLVVDVITWAIGAVKDYLARRKRVKETQEAAKRVEDAKTPQDVRDSVDDLP